MYDIYESIVIFNCKVLITDGNRRRFKANSAGSGRQDRRALGRIDRAGGGGEIGSKQRDPDPQDDSLIRNEPSTYKGFHYTIAALFFY